MNIEAGHLSTVSCLTALMVVSIYEQFSKPSRSTAILFWISGFELSSRVESHLAPLPTFAELQMCSGAVADTSCSVSNKTKQHGCSKRHIIQIFDNHDPLDDDNRIQQPKNAMLPFTISERGKKREKL